MALLNNVTHNFEFPPLLCLQFQFIKMSQTKFEHKFMTFHNKKCTRVATVVHVSSTNRKFKPEFSWHPCHYFSQKLQTF
jgi:hypothetical protein